MSNDKLKSKARQFELLNRMAKHKTGRIYLNCLGGISRNNPDLVKLVDSGYAVIKRDPGVPKWTKKFWQRPTHYHGGWGDGWIRRSYAEITQSGRNRIMA